MAAIDTERRVKRGKKKAKTKTHHYYDDYEDDDYYYSHKSTKTKSQHHHHSHSHSGDESTGGSADNGHYHLHKDSSTDSEHYHYHEHPEDEHNSHVHSDGSSDGSSDKNNGGDSSGNSGESDDNKSGYFYGRGACPEAGKKNVPCAPDNLAALCNKYDSKGRGSFKECFEACKPSFCCIHDAYNNEYAVPCRDDENCPAYSYCYSVWWKLHDTIGPALYLQVEQSDDFFDMTGQELLDNIEGTFNEQLLLHHFDDVEKIIKAGTDKDTGMFNAVTIFNDPEYWQQSADS